MDQDSWQGAGRLKSGAYTVVFESVSGGRRAAIRGGGPWALRRIFETGPISYLRFEIAAVRIVP